ncbi:hypothetical protein WKT22_01568 [Candidatus Lokiarchaeum ossiferum]
MVSSFQKTLTNEVIRKEIKKKKIKNSNLKEKSKIRIPNFATKLNRKLDFYDPILKLKKQVDSGIMIQNKETILIKSILDQKKEVANLKDEIKKLQQKSKEDNEFLKELLLKALEVPKIPQMIPMNYSQFTPPINANPSYSTTQSSFTPPPPPPSKQSKPPQSYQAPNTGNLKKDYIQEIQQIFTGDILKPSQIVQTTKPRHLEHEVEEISDNFDIPPIDIISTAKNFISSSENMIQA